MECLWKIANAFKLTDIEKGFQDLAVSGKGDLDWEQLKEEGNIHYKNSRWTEAFNCYTKAIKISPKGAVLYSNRALCELQLGKLQLARNDAEVSRGLDPKRIKTHRILSEALYKLSLFEEAKQVCRDGLKIDPKDEVLLHRLTLTKTSILDKEIFKNPQPDGMKLSREWEDAQNLLTDEIPADEILQINLTMAMGSLQLPEAHKIMSNCEGDILKEQEALKIFESAAKVGSAEGLYNTALMHRYAKAGLPQDIQRAKELYFKAAAQKPFIQIEGMILAHRGVAEAENSIAIMYRDGLGVDKDEKLAFDWFLKSAQHGCPSAQNSLGVCLRSGTGCSQNLESAQWWFQKSADLGCAEGQFNLAQMLINAEGGGVECTKAADLLKQAAQQGLPGAVKALQDLLRSGAQGMKSMRDAPKIIADLASNNDKHAIFLLGLNYLEGTGGFGKNLSKAEENLRKASELGHPNSDCVLGQLLLEQTRNSEGLKFIQKAAERGGNPIAEQTLALLFALGHGCQRDLEQARRWFMSASKGLNFDFEAKLAITKKVVEFEAKKKLSVLGVTVQNRMDRFLVAISHRKEELKDFVKFRTFCAENPPRPMQDASRATLKTNEMWEKAVSGSLSAQKFINGLNLLSDAEECLERGDDSKAIRLFNRSIQLWELLPLKPNTLKALNVVAQRVLAKNQRDAEALSVVLRYQAAMQYDVHQLVIFVLLH